MDNKSEGRTGGHGPGTCLQHHLVVTRQSRQHPALLLLLPCPGRGRFCSHLVSCCQVPSTGQARHGE